MRGWPGSFLLLLMSVHCCNANAAAAGRLRPRDDTPSAFMGKEELGSTSSQMSSPAIAGSSPFDSSSNQSSLLQAASDVYNNSTSPGRHLTHIDRILQQNYHLIGCKAGLPGAAAEQLKFLITQIRLNLKLVIRETLKGTASPFGFEAFFKTNDNVHRVLKIFHKIANGARVRAPDSYGRTHWLKPKKGAPIIGCAFSAPEALFSDQAHHDCQDPPRYAYHPSGSAWIYLCPDFWKAPSHPSYVDCPNVYDNGTVGPEDIALHMNRQAILVHELVHMYLAKPSRNSTEHYTIESAIALSAEEAVENASNYGYFYSGMFCVMGLLWKIS